jgi:hypothetical protein
VKKIEANGYVKEGRFHIRNRPQFEREVSQFADCELWVTIEKKRSKRSIQQNRYYFGVCVSLIQERFKELGTDCSKEDVHCFLRGKFLYNEAISEHGEVFQIPRSTTELSKSEFMDYIAKIQQFAAETLDIIIPEPNEQISIEL